MTTHPLRSLRLLPALLLAAGAQAQVNWSTVQWFTWTPALNPAANLGTSTYGNASVTVTGTHAANAGTGTANFDVLGNGSYTMATATLGLGAPRANSIATYTIDLSAFNIPTSNLIIAIANLDATNGRGSITVSATDSGSPLDVNTWTTEAQFKQQAGLQSAQSLVTRAPLGNNMLLGTVQAGDNTSWGDSRGIFFSNLQGSIDMITLAHQYNHSNPTVSDNITLSIGVIPEPASAAVAAGATALALALVTRRRR